MWENFRKEIESTARLSGHASYRLTLREDGAVECHASTWKLQRVWIYSMTWECECGVYSRAGWSSGSHINLALFEMRFEPHNVSGVVPEVLAEQSSKSTFLNHRDYKHRPQNYRMHLRIVIHLRKRHHNLDVLIIWHSDKIWHFSKLKWGSGKHLLPGASTL